MIPSRSARCVPSCPPATNPIVCTSAQEPGGHAGIGCHEFRQSLGKNPLGTGGGATDEFAHGEQKENIPTSTGQVGDCSLVGSMDASGGLLGTKGKPCLWKYTLPE